MHPTCADGLVDAYIYPPDKMKRTFFQAAVASILLYGCTTWTLTKRMEKKLDGNYTRMLRAILNKSWQQHPTRHQLYGHLPPITKTIQVRRTRHAGHCWRSRDELIRDVLLWIPTHGRAKTGRPARTYIQQLCEDTGCYPEDLPRAMNDSGERGSGISVLPARYDDDDDSYVYRCINNYPRMRVHFMRMWRRGQSGIWHSSKCPSQDSYFGHMVNRQIMWRLIWG